MESDLVYSKEALEAKSAFYNKDFTIYVEGKDDILFWDNLCKKAAIRNYHIEDVGGAPIRDYIKILNEDKTAGFIVACDANYDDFKSRNTSKKIIKTFGHSIENSMYFSIEKIDQVVKTYAKNLNSSTNEIKEAIQELVDGLRALLIFELANDIFDRSLSVLTNSCNRFLLADNSFRLCTRKINKVINQIKHNFTEEQIHFCNEKLSKSKKYHWFYIRGHFLTTWIYKLIKILSERLSGVKVDLTYDAIYSSFVICSNNQPDIKPIIRKLKLAVADVY